MEKENFPVVSIIPSLNPDGKLPETIAGLLSVGFSDIIIVNDGSRADCQPIFRQLENLPGCIVLTHEINRGKGCALKTAFSYYLEHFDQKQFCGVVTADADGQHLPQDIYNTALAVMNDHSNKCFLSLGTRNFDDPIVPPKSRNGNKITTRIFKMLYGKLINDTQTGLRGISNTFLPQCLEMKGDKFEYEINMLIVAARNNYLIEEIPIQTVYFESNRETHFHPVKDSIRIYRVMFAPFLKFTCSGLLSVVVDQGLFAILLYLFFHGSRDAVAIPLATMVARIGSSFLNYTMNRVFVFSAGKATGKNLVQYYSLCVVQMLLSALLVTSLHLLTNGNASLLKFAVDGLLFLFSYRIQQGWIFREK